ncbi:ABC transporter substrate-binding protein [Nocardiopsis sp. HNM0947]|uniref:ABC transporter substrate-binding protein n=1 Tax=Nocardiopsis coralli TaxID=2772213 RepID=A0ABR9P3M2_9ACTN|nr:ABC transporter substrate-binding protein [Nocardiopsis coralli]
MAPVLVLTGCGTAGGETGSPSDGGTLAFALAADPSCVDPQQSGNNQALNVGRQVVDSLTDQDPETGEIVPWLAEDWEVSDDADEYTFHLRDGVTFSDGEPLDAEAVRANFDTVSELGALAELGSSYLGGYAGTEVHDDLSLTVRFDDPNAQFLQATSTMSLGLVSPVSLEETTPEQRCQGEYEGSGPFTLDSYEPEQQVTTTAREDYDWSSERTEHTGPARLDGIDFRIVPESGVRTGALLSGEVDAIADIPPQDEERFEGDDVQVLTRPNPGIPFNLHPNLASPTFDDPAIVQALQLAVDRQEIVDTVLSERYPVAAGPLAEVTDHAAGTGDGLQHDPEAAAELLDEAGWTEGGDGVRTKDGEPLELDVIFSPLFNANETVLELLQQQFRDLGVDLELRSMTPAEYDTVQQDGDYDLAWYNLTRTDPDVLRTLFHTEYADRTGLGEEDELDALLADQAATSDPGERADLVEQAESHIIEEGYIVPVFEFAQIHGLGQHVHGVEFEASSRLSFYEAWTED